MPAAAGPKATILSINDVYQIEGIDGGRSGGMARVRALRAELEKTAPDLLLLHAGDFLGPSFIGRTFHGAQMIDVMGLMQGAAAPGHIDERMFVTFGNHEFDETSCDRAGPLPRLVADSAFTWLASNLDFTRCDNLKSLADSPRIAKSRIVESGGLKIGLFSLTLAYPEYAAAVLDPFDTACRQIEDLRRQGADAVLALTHLRFTTDLELIGLGPDFKEIAPEKRRCPHSPDLIVGGHDHTNMALPHAAPRLFKADADAESAYVIEIEKQEAGLKIAGRLVPLDGGRKRDAFVQRIVAGWLARNDERFCLKDCLGMAPETAKACLKSVDDGACLNERYARIASPIVAEEIANRSFETGFGNWLADRLRDAGEADVALVNSGAIRLNQNLAAGTILTRRHLEQMFPYKSKLVTRDVTGAVLWRAMEHSVRQRGEGAWAHFSGMAVALAEPGSPSPIAALKARRRDGSVVAIGPQSRDVFRLASFAFVLANGDGHGFEVCPPGTAIGPCIAAIEAAPAWPLKGEGAEITGLVRLRLGETDQARGLELPVDRRFCDRGSSGCLVARW
jgi:2',3'-cyclic-nucleotide 2'-phosphodiesterase (5'-nucleotidase family)